MLHLLGLLLKTIITIAIGIMGFTWEPKQEVKSPPGKEKLGELMVPVYLTSPVHKAIVIDADCNATLHSPTVPPAPQHLRDGSISI